MTAGETISAEPGDQPIAIDLSVVIVSYNTRDLLRGCLRSVRDSQTLSPGLVVETWVADNHSPDDSAAMVAAEFKWARLIARADNAGFAAANNEALRQSAGRHVLLLNPDTVVRADALGQIVTFFDANPRTGGLGAKLVYPDGSRQQSAFRFPTLLMSFLDYFPINHRLTNSRLNGRYPALLANEIHEIDHPLGACFAVRREVLTQVGLLDEGFFMYCEEVDWAIRIRRAGWPLYYLPTAEVIHYEGQSARQFRTKMFVELHRSRLRLFAKHYCPAYRWAVRRINWLGMIAEARRARQAAAAGLISPTELAARLEAYEQVKRL